MDKCYPSDLHQLPDQLVGVRGPSLGNLDTWVQYLDMVGGSEEPIVSITQPKRLVFC